MKREGLIHLLEGKFARNLIPTSPDKTEEVGNRRCQVVGHDWFALEYPPRRVTKCLRCNLITEATVQPLLDRNVPH